MFRRPYARTRRRVDWGLWIAVTIVLIGVAVVVGFRIYNQTHGLFDECLTRSNPRPLCHEDGGSR